MLNQKPSFQKNQPSEVFPSFSLDNTTENIIHWLSLFEESELLSLFVDIHKQQFLTKKNKTKEDWLKIISLWTKTKKYLEIFQSLEAMEDNVRSNFLKKHTHLLFVLDHLEEVEKASKKWNVPKAFILAIIRQESAFNIRARSPADAFGTDAAYPLNRQTNRQKI